MRYSRFAFSIAPILAMTGAFAATNGPALIEKVAQGPSFSFVYGGKESKDLLPSWKKTTSRAALADGRERIVTVWRDPASGLEVTRELIRFEGSPAVETMLRLRNTGAADTAVVEKILPLDLRFTAPGTGKILMHYARGCLGSMADYQPIDKEVASGTEID